MSEHPSPKVLQQLVGLLEREAAVRVRIALEYPQLATASSLQLNQLAFALGLRRHEMIWTETDEELRQRIYLALFHRFITEQAQ